ncbi:MAG: hypothetical protein ABI618_15355 [Nitrospirota bacterium]
MTYDAGGTAKSEEYVQAIVDKMGDHGMHLILDKHAGKYTAINNYLDNTQERIPHQFYN